MKLTTLLLITVILQVRASTFAQQIILSEKNAPIEKVFFKIREQTGYDFLFTTSMLKSARPVTIQVRNGALDDVLKQILKVQPLEFSIEDKTVVILPKKGSTPVRVKAPIVLPIDVKGRVVDSLSGNPLGGASISVKGRQQATKADSDGFFVLQNVDENATVVISFIGYKTKELKPTKDLGLIRMDVAVASLQEVGVVNTGYQRIRPEQSTGAIAQITTKAYESRINTNFLDGLANRLPGLMINNNVLFTSTTPGNNGSTSRSLFNIRGISTMSANQTPLIVIDGYPTELTVDLLDPNEIKSVTILKDAAAATVYGVRASNGVIVVERKQAVAGRPRFTFRATTSITPKENFNRYRFANDESSIVTDYEKTRYSGSINPDTWGLLSTPGNLIYNTARSSVYYLLAQSAAKIITPDQEASSYAALQGYDNRKDYSNLFLRSAITQTYNLNASGGNENALYYITANYTGNRQMQLNNDDNRFLLSGRTTIKMSKRLALELTTDYQEQRFNNAPVPALTSLYPFERLQDVNGNPMAVAANSWVNPFYNSYLLSSGLQDNLYYPLVDVNEVTDKTRTYNNRITANFTYNIGNGFDLLFGGIYETSRSEIRHYASENSSEAKQYINAYTALNDDGSLTYNIPPGGFLRQQADNTYSYTARTQLNYNKKIGDHSFNGILGAEVRNLVNKTNLASYFGYNDETLLQQPVDYASIINGTTTGSFSLSSPFQNQYSTLFNQLYTEDRFVSGYANMVYAYKNTYSLTGSVRVDQSNLFGTNPKYKYKPLWSLGAAWNIDKENFMQQIDWISQLKFRAAYGFNGNVAKLSLPQVIAQSVINPYTSPSSTALSLLSYANSSLRWEQTKNLNLGLDYSIFKNITGTVDFYTKRSTDLLGNVQIDPTIGISPSIINRATINNKGIEVSLHADWVSTNNFNWNTGFVLSRNTSKVLDVYQRSAYNPQTLNPIGYVKGYPVGAMFAYRDAGLNSNGYPQVKNQNGVIYQTDDSSLGSTQTTILGSDTSGVTRYMGSSIPTINAGLSNRVDIGSFYVYAMFNYYGGFKVRIPRGNPSALRPLPGSGNYWRNPGDENTTDIPTLAAFINANSNYAYNNSDKYVVNGDYITLGDLTLSYSLDKTKFIKKLGFSHFEVKLQGTNLWTHGFNKYNYSPATGSYEKAYLTPTYTMGIFTNF